MPPPHGPSGKPIYNPLPTALPAHPAPTVDKASALPPGPTLVTGATGFVGSAVALNYNTA